jgi:uncharacterized membrane protein
LEGPFCEPVLVRALDLHLRDRDAWFLARRRLGFSVLIGLLAGAVLSAFAAWQVSVLGAWCVMSGLFIVLTWATMLRSDSDRTRALATREDESRATADLILVVACIASLVGVGLILLKASKAHGVAVAAMTGLGVVSVVLAWATVHTVYTLRYADLFYAAGGGIDFKQEEAPEYRDFAYVAFTIGMTYQVSDTDVQNKLVRHTVFRHALLSYLFGAAMIAMTINVVAGLAK